METINIFDLDVSERDWYIKNASWATINKFNQVHADAIKDGKSESDALEFAQAAMDHEAEVQKLMLTGLPRDEAVSAVDAGMTVNNIKLYI